MNDDKLIKNLMEKSRLEMPFPDFEDEVMMQIEMEESLSHSTRKHLLWSWFFFGIGVIAGVLLTFLIPQFDISFAGLDAGQLNLLFQIGFYLFVLLHLEKLITVSWPAKRQPVMMN